jgi:hypothetical protein
MNIGSTLGTAILRSFYLAAGAGLVAFLPAWAVTDQLKAPLISGALGALWALGFRGGGEGLYDAQRQRDDDVKASDVKVG